MKKRNFGQRLAALAAALALTAALAGCGSSGGAANASGAMESTNAAPMESQSAADGSTVPTLTPGATGESARKVIYNADLTLETTDFDAARTAVTDAVEGNGGYISYSNISGSADDHDRSVNYTVRIPADNYRTFIEALGSAGNVLSVSERAQDITADYIDVQARITSLENQRDRLNELADQAETTADLLEIENQLANVQYELESYTQQRNWMDDQVQYSTVEIWLEEVELLTPETPAGFLEEAALAFVGGWNAFGSFLKWVALSVIYVWPLLIIAVVVVIVLVRTRPAREAKRQARAARRAAGRPAPRSPEPPKPAAPDSPAPDKPDDTPPQPKY